MKKFKMEQIQKLLNEKKVLAIKGNQNRTPLETARLREINESPLPKGLKDYDYQYFTPLWLKLCKKVGKFLMDVKKE
jgi:hypothetical protein